LFPWKEPVLVFYKERQQGRIPWDSIRTAFPDFSVCDAGRFLFRDALKLSLFFRVLLHQFPRRSIAAMLPAFPDAVWIGHLVIGADTHVAIIFTVSSVLAVNISIGTGISLRRMGRLQPA
jgi:hypothetical protein